MGTRPLTAVVAAIVLAGVAACGDDEQRGAEALREHSAKLQEAGEERAEKIRRWVRDGRLPAVALELIGPDGTINFSFMGDPGTDRDVVRTRDGGDSGPKLRWDLDGDGRKETNITERDLYDATLGI